MAGKKGSDNSKKAAGQARKAQAAADKAAAEDAKKAAAEDADWQRGAKSNAKKEAQASKKAEQAQKKAERDAALAEEEKNLPSGGPKKSKTAVKKTNRGLDLSQFEKGDKTYNFSGLDNALDGLNRALTGEADVKIDRHPERRYAAALASFKARRLKEMEEDGTKKLLNLRQREQQIAKEFKKSPENPLNSTNIVSHNATKDEINELKQREASRIDALYAEDSK
ncbi:hypothetical protein Daesc_000557 [Daldinia eschscholtzii]|uniref:DUF1014-domain-containing protein n=1 Tax=Daldinia eschscholtzii TaxID=292717 RepID=A0AAX6MYP5_9PEZI